MDFVSVARVSCLSSVLSEFSVVNAFLYPVVVFSLPEAMFGTIGTV